MVHRKPWRLELLTAVSRQQAALGPRCHLTLKRYRRMRRPTAMPYMLFAYRRADGSRVAYARLGEGGYRLSYVRLLETVRLLVTHHGLMTVMKLFSLRLNIFWVAQKSVLKSSENDVRVCILPCCAHHSFSYQSGFGCVCVCANMLPPFYLW